MHSRPMCLQCVCFSVSMALLVELKLSLAVLAVVGVPSLSPLFSAVFFHSAIWLECDGCLEGAWREGLVAWLQVGRPVGCSSALGM